MDMEDDKGEETTSEANGLEIVRKETKVPFVIMGRTEGEVKWESGGEDVVLMTKSL